MHNYSARLRATLWWLLPLTALAATIGWETDWGRAVETRLLPPEAIAPKPVAMSLLPEYAIAGGTAARTETVERTLFNPTRRPAPVVAQEIVQAKMQRGQFSLTGTTVAEGKSTAFLREATGKSRRVQAGDSINGLKVAEVKADRVKLTLGDESEELVLKVAINSRPTAQPPVAAFVPSPTFAAFGPSPPVPGAIQAAAQSAPPEDPQTLAERRRAARAAQVAAGGGTPPPDGVAPPTMPAAAAAVAPEDPRWGQMDQRYRERAATIR